MEAIGAGDAGARPLPRYQARPEIKAASTAAAPRIESAARPAPTPGADPRVGRRLLGDIESRQVEIRGVERDPREPGQGDQVEPVAVGERPGRHPGPAADPRGQGAPDLPRQRVDRRGRLDRDPTPPHQGRRDPTASGWAGASGGLEGVIVQVPAGRLRVAAVQSFRKAAASAKGSHPSLR